jgi:type IV pilus assembly protein PilC
MAVIAQTTQRIVIPQIPLLSGWVRRLFGEPIPTDELARFFERLSLMLSSGMGAPESLRAAALKANPELKRIAEAVAEPVSNGMPLHKALAPWKGRLPELVIPVLEVGEISGTLEGASRRLALAFDKSSSVNQKFEYSVLNPQMAAVLILFNFVAAGFAGFFLPSMLDLLLLTLKVLALWFGARLVFHKLMKWERLRMSADTVKLALPHMGKISRKLAAARWGRSFVTMWEAGVPISQALEVSSHSALNAYYEREIQAAARKTREGCLLTDSLAGSAMLPGQLLDVLRTGEVTGRFGNGLEHFVVLLEGEALQMATQEFAALAVALNILGALFALATIGLFTAFR